MDLVKIDDIYSESRKTCFNLGTNALPLQSIGYVAVPIPDRT